jgi:hypothetical protein
MTRSTKSNANNMDNDNEQRRKKAREARAEGKAPSEVGATTGASTQTKRARGNASHQERQELKGEGKQSPGTSGKPRPGNRETDPKRTERWG